MQPVFPKFGSVYQTTRYRIPNDNNIKFSFSLGLLSCSGAVASPHFQPFDSNPAAIGATPVTFVFCA
jgi:hypothetical protein